MKKIDGKYRVLEGLGEGFGGSVFLVEANGEKVALKQLRTRADHECLSSEEILDNFKEEFSTLKNLNHPHILRILDFGFDTKEKFYYFTTEYIEGTDIFQATRGLDPQEIEELIVQTLRALSYLHNHGVYHFDVKPTNILVGKNPEGKRFAKLIDFGLTAFFKKGLLAGSPAYLAPETLMDERRDGRADLYSLGVTWYTCLTGKNPFDTGDLKKTISLQRVWAPPLVSTQSPELPSYLDSILEKLLRKNPALRYHRADQVIRDLNWSGPGEYSFETEATALAYLPGEGRLVGRQEEWSRLMAHFDRVFMTKRASKACVFISGGPGTGKSRLLKEFKYHAQLQTIPVFPLGEKSISDLNSDCLLLGDDADLETLKSARHWMLQDSAHSFLILLAAKILPESASLEDNIQLHDFGRKEVSEYVASILGMDHSPEFLVEELFSRSEGNPRFLTDLLHSLIRSHQIFDQQGRWSPTILQEVGIDFKKLSVPKTILEYCREKLHSLPERLKKALSLVALAKTPLAGNFLKQLGLELEKTDWEILKGENVISLDSAGNDIRLLNPSFRDCLPDLVDPQVTAALHQSLGEGFLKISQAREAAWYHLGHGIGTLRERFGYLLKYGDSLFSQNRWLEAARVFEDASQIISDAEQKVEAGLKKVRSLFRSGNHSEGLTLLEDMRAVLKLERENPQQWRWIQSTYREMTNIYLKEERLELARESLQASRALLEEHEDNAVEEMILDNFKASLLLREGKLSEARAIAEETEGRWSALPLELKIQVLNNELPCIYLALGDTEKAKDLFKKWNQFFNEMGRLDKQACALYGWAECCYALHEFAEALQAYQSCIELCRRIKNEELLFHTFNGMGNVAFMVQDWPRAAKYYQEALELAEHQVNSDGALAIAINLGLVFRLQGDFGSSQLYLRHVIDTLEGQAHPSLHQLQFLTQGYLELGKLKIEMSQWVEARDAFRDATQRVRSNPGLERFRYPALMGLMKSDISLERISEAQTVLKELEKQNLSLAEKEELEGYKGDLRTAINFNGQAKHASGFK